MQSPSIVKIEVVESEVQAESSQPVAAENLDEEGTANSLSLVKQERLPLQDLPGSAQVLQAPVVWAASIDAELGRLIQHIRQSRNPAQAVRAAIAAVEGLPPPQEAPRPAEPQPQPQPQPADSPTEALVPPAEDAPQPSVGAASYMEGRDKCRKLMKAFRSNPNNANKTPLSVLNEYATRLNLQLTFSEEAESKTGPFNIEARLLTRPAGALYARGSGRGRGKKDARQAAAAAALEILLESVPMSEFLQPGSRFRPRADAGRARQQPPRPDNLPAGKRAATADAQVAPGCSKRPAGYSNTQGAHQRGGGAAAAYHGAARRFASAHACTGYSAQHGQAGYGGGWGPGDSQGWHMGHLSGGEGLAPGPEPARPGPSQGYPADAGFQGRAATGTVGALAGGAPTAPRRTSDGDSSRYSFGDHQGALVSGAGRSHGLPADIASNLSRRMDIDRLKQHMSTASVPLGAAGTGRGSTTCVERYHPIFGSLGEPPPIPAVMARNPW
uniref:DRBM domain-containing protein n=1 Tax=Tetraselmis sp. GSL018 TaxID=582737 RepID=A0A061SHK5_9CHLO